MQNTQKVQGSLNTSNGSFNQTTEVLNKSSHETTISRAEVDLALETWGSNLVSISKTFRAGEDYQKTASELIKKTYNYEIGPVLFKPTLASVITFRNTFEGALSYFVAGNSDYTEDRGFALNPWEKVNFEIAGVVLAKDHAIVMGNKLLSDITGRITKANFTMGFIRDENGKLKINLHHSSLPYLPA